MKNKYFYLVLFFLPLGSGCSHFIEIEPPRTDLIRENVFTTDDKANAAMVDVYYQMHLSGFASGDQNSISFLAALSADDAINGITSPGYQQFNDNALLASTEPILVLWSDLYKVIYRCNAIIAGLSQSKGVSDATRAQLLGEARFVRAFCYFYLVNLFGDTPIVTSTDYAINQNISRSPIEEVYSFIVEDLEYSVGALPMDYALYGDQRIRATQWAALAILARTKLQMGSWDDAARNATSIIENSALFQLVPLDQVFLKDNSEAILAVLPRFGNTQDWSVATYNSTLTPALINAFETDDNRKIEWISDNVSVKYKGPNDDSENSIVIRLAEIYLLRAEARTRLNDFDGAAEDINVIRRRANLPDKVLTDQNSALDAILQERRLEYFMEWGHRWLDLKRLDRATTALGTKPDWQQTDLLYPIPEEQILNDPAMRNQQNPGY